MFISEVNLQLVVRFVSLMMSATHFLHDKGTSDKDANVQISIPSTGLLHLSKSSVVGIITVVLVANIILGASTKMIVLLKCLVGNGLILNTVAGCLCSIGMIIERPSWVTYVVKEA